MVHGRVNIGAIDEFGVSGYVYKNVFVLYDRRTESLWYPFDKKQWTAISGPRQGERIPFIENPGPIPLGEWRKLHPNTLVLLGDRGAIFEATASD